MGQSETCDVLVIGGGPGGSTASTYLARKGRKVIMLEKDHHPRFHIGESMLPLTMPILQDLGVFNKIKAIGVPKHGADFAAPQDISFDDYRTYYFRDALHCRFPHAFQVKREEYDEILFKHAAESGADAREGVTVERVNWNDAGTAQVETVDEAGNKATIEARYVVDASGRDTLLANQFKSKQSNPHHRSAAIYSHFRGVTGREGEDAGNIAIYWMPHGWGWIIPLREGVTSVGCVCRPEYLKQRRGVPQEQFLMDTLRAVPSMWKRMENTERVEDVRMAGNYSYHSTRIAGKGWIMVGDAYSFLDPVFSSGVYLAMSSARRAASVVDQVLDKPRRESALQRRYGRETRRGMSHFAWFIYRFTTPTTKALFRAPSNKLQIQQAVTSMLAGDIYVNRSVLRRLVMFKLIYRVMSWRAA